MSLFSDIKQLSGADLELLIFGVAGMIAPGVVAIWFFAPDFLASATTPKLIVCAAALTSPSIAANTIMIVIRPFGVLARLTSGGDSFGVALTFGAMITGALSFACLAVAFLASMTLRSFVILVLAVQFAVVVVFLVRGVSKLKAL